MKTVEITVIENLKLGTPKQCHYNAAMYAIENNCKFVCGILDRCIPIPHCIVEKDGVYIDPTINESGEFRVIATYTADQINKLFSKVGKSFIPFMGDGLGNNVYDGMKRVPKKDLEKWMDNIHKIMYNI